jgi:hypothetical protein
MSGAFGENSMPVAAALSNRAMVEQRASDFAAAAHDYDRAVAIARTHKENRPLMDIMVHRYAAVLKAMHRTQEAKALLTQSAAEARSFQPN